MLKRDSKAWQLAKKQARRKGCNHAPIALSECGQFVTMRSLIRGNQWRVSLVELETMEQSK